MKKTFKFFAAALVIVASASCAKEEFASKAPVALQEKTFSATIAEPVQGKAVIEDDGVFRFSEGDYILVFNNNPSAERSIYRSLFTTVDGKSVVYDATETSRIIAERIQITADMLSSGGKTVTFSTVVSSLTSMDARANLYHFFYLSDGAYTDWSYTSNRADDNANYAAATGFYRKQNSPYTATTRRVMCYARSQEMSGDLKFYHFDSQFKFKVSDAANYDKVTIEANGEAGAKNSINPDIAFYPGRVLDYTKEYSGSNLAYNPNSVSTGTHPVWYKGAYQYTHNSNESNGSKEAIVTLSGNSESTYYVSVPALYTYEQGVTFKLWKNGEVVKTLTAGSPITTEVAGVINFGDLAKLRKNTYTSYYAMWQDGVSFKIGETVVDPKAAPYSSMNPVYVESSCNLSSISGWTNANNVYFVKSGATLTIDSAKYWNDDVCTLYIIGDDIAARSEVVWNKTLAPRGGAVALKNINITSCVTNSLDSEGKLSEYFVMDGCRIVLPANEFGTAISGASSGWNRIELVNNDFIYTAGVNSKLLKVLPTAAYTFESLTIKNNQSYPSTDALSGSSSCIIWDYWQGRASFNSIDFENNTFVNCAYDYNVVYCAAQGVAVGGTLTIKNNINYVDGPVTSYAKLVLLADANKTGVTIDASKNYGWATGSIGKMQVWGNVGITAFSADPFESKDFTNGVFTLTSAAAAVATDCGAKR